MTELGVGADEVARGPSLRKLTATSSGSDESRAATVRKEITLLARNVHKCLHRRRYPKGERGYDIRDDQALPNLQTAINQESAYRRRTMRLRQACLAGVVA